MDHVIDINEGPCVAHCCWQKSVGILSMLLLLSVCGVFLINAALVHAQWPQITVLVGIMVLTVLAILLVGLCDRYIGVKIVVAITQLLPCAVLFTTAEVIPMGIFTANSIGHLFLLDFLMGFPRWLLVAAGACHVICLFIASVFDDVGWLSVYFDFFCDAVHDCQMFSLKPKQAAIVVGLLVPLVQMAVLFKVQQALLTRYKSALEVAEARAEAASQTSNRMLQVVSHELQNPLHVITGFAESVVKIGGSVGGWGKEINNRCRELLVCHSCARSV